MQTVSWPRCDIAINRLRELRESSEISIAELAKQLYCSRRTIKRYERGEYPIMPEIIPGILKMFCIQIPDLFPQYDTSDGGATYCFSHLEVEGYVFTRITKTKLDQIRYRADGSQIKEDPVKVLPPSSTNTQKQQDLGQQFKQLREEKGLSVTQLSHMTGLSRRTLGRYESGERPIPANRRALLAEMLGVKTHSPAQPLLALPSPVWPLLLPAQIDLPWYGDNKILITNLRRIRGQRDWTEEKCAGELNISTEKLEAWESGKEEIPGYYRLRLLHILKTVPEELFPQLASFNGGHRYIPITMDIKGFRYWNERGSVWPLRRYKKNLEGMEPLIYPKDLTPDEYFNLDEDMFAGLSGNELPVFDMKRLPRQYQLNLEAGKGYGMYSEARDPANAKNFGISHAKFIDLQRHVPKVIDYSIQHRSLILKYENGDTRLLKLAPYWRGSEFYSRLQTVAYLEQGSVVSVPVRDDGYADKWETQYLVWPEGQIICLDEAYFYSVPLQANAQEEPYGYIRFFQQYIMMFQSDIID